MNNWIPISERLPTREDADETGNVLKRRKNGDIAPGPWNTKPETGSTYVAWLPLPRYTSPKPGPTDAECDRLCGEVRTAPGYGAARHLVCEWFAAVTARIEKEKGK